MTKIVPDNTNKCYLCLDEAEDKEKSPCECKSIIHPEPCFEGLVQKHIELYPKNHQEKQLTCTICKKPFSSKKIKKISQKIIKKNPGIIDIENQIPIKRPLFVWNCKCDCQPNSECCKICDKILHTLFFLIVAGIFYGIGIVVQNFFYPFTAATTDLQKYGGSFFYGLLSYMVVGGIMGGCRILCCLGFDSETH